jgi:PAS domain S-box-containing protein
MASIPVSTDVLRGSPALDGQHAGGPDGREHEPHHHAVQFYENEAYLASVVSEFLAEGAKANQPIVVVATPSHRAAFSKSLRDMGVNVGALRRSGQLHLLDARQTLSRFMVGEVPDSGRFATTIGRVITRSLSGREGMPVRAYGEMVDLLWKDGNTEGAIQLERLWNDLARQYHFSLLCAYSMGNFCRANDAEAFHRICAEHSHVAPTEGYADIDEHARLLEISRLQQRARAYEAEVAEREIVERRLRDTVVTLNEREAQLREREADLRDVLENAAEGIHLVGPDGTIEWANRAELEMLGYAEEEYVGRNIVEFHVDELVIQRILARLSAGETLHGAEARLRHKDGSIRHVLVSSNVRWRDGKFLHTRCFTKDITELRLATRVREEALAAERAARLDAERARREADEARAVAEEARVLAEQANRAKSEFLAVMSHELRTPLNAIGGYAELMELGIHGQVTPPQREALARIQRSQRMLLGLINQVLNYARIETGNVQYDLASIPLEEALRSAEGLITPQLRAKGLRFESPECDSAIVVRADGEKLQQIVLNLLGNAVKFTDRGGLVRMTVEIDRDVVLIRVSDTGIGIAGDKLDTIFEPFVQVDAHYTRTRDGVGLGLAISRDLAEGMGGGLSVSSVEGSGSTFTLRLPRGDDAGPVGLGAADA